MFTVRSGATKVRAERLEIGGTILLDERYVLVGVACPKGRVYAVTGAAVSLRFSANATMPNPPARAINAAPAIGLEFELPVTAKVG